MELKNYEDIRNVKSERGQEEPRLIQSLHILNTPRLPVPAVANDPFATVDPLAALMDPAGWEGGGRIPRSSPTRLL